MWFEVGIYVLVLDMKIEDLIWEVYWVWEEEIDYVKENGILVLINK